MHIVKIMLLQNMMIFVYVSSEIHTISLHTFVQGIRHNPDSYVVFQETVFKAWRKELFQE